MPEKPESPKNIYDRLGGEKVMDSITMTFYSKISTDDRVSGYFKELDILKQIQHQKEFLTFVFGGSTQYSGQSLEEAHANLKITEEDYAAIVEILHSTLENMNLDKDLIQEIMGIVASRKNEIVTANP